MTSQPVRAPSTREGLLALGAGCVLACLMFWPLPLRLGEVVPRDLGDPLLQAWQLAWGGHALEHQPLDFFQANTFWPLRDSLAFSEALVGYAPLGLIGEGQTAAVVRYDLVFLLAYGVAFAGAYLLARDVGLPPLAAAVAGVAFAYAPWRLEQNGHLHVVSSGGIPLSLALLLHGYRDARPWVVVAGFAVAAWQVSIGFTLGIQIGYLLALLGLLSVLLWLRRGRPRLDRRLLRATLAGAALLTLVGGVLALPYLAVVEEHPEAHRTIADLELFSPPLRSFAAASPDNLVWGGITAPVRDDLPQVPEQTLFPGLVILALAAVGIWRAPWGRGVRVGLLAGTAVAALLSLGLQVAEGWAGYRWLYELAPGWAGVRTPGRINTLTSLGLGLLAAGGAEALRRRLRPRLAGAACVGLCALILLEGAGFEFEDGRLRGHPAPAVPDPPAGLADAEAPRLHLPVTTFRSFAYMLWTSDDGFPEIVNGTSGFHPRFLARLAERVRGFPDARSAALLRRLGVRTVVLHPDDVGFSPWAAWRRRPLDGLGLTPRRVGGVVLYDLD